MKISSLNHYRLGIYICSFFFNFSLTLVVNIHLTMMIILIFTRNFSILRMTIFFSECFVFECCVIVILKQQFFEIDPKWWWWWWSKDLIVSDFCFVNTMQTNEQISINQIRSVVFVVVFNNQNKTKIDK